MILTLLVVLLVAIAVVGVYYSVTARWTTYASGRGLMIMFIATAVSVVDSGLERIRPGWAPDGLQAVAILLTLAAVTYLGGAIFSEQRRWRHRLEDVDELTDRADSEDRKNNNL